MAGVVANGPISINLSSGFHLIPITLLDVSVTGEITADRWEVTVTSEDVARIKVRLRALVESGVLRRTEAAATVPAMIITAAQAGAAAKRAIEIEFANVDSDATPPTADTTVTETDTYESLTPATVEEELGNAPGTGNSPGLVFVTDVDPTKLPTANTYALAIPGAGGPAEVVVPADEAGSPPAFTVKASKAGPDGEAIEVEIKDVNAAEETFTLVATWTKTKNAVEVDAVDELNTEFGYLITVEPPPGAASPLLPAEGRTRLRGGAAAQPATATVVTGT